MQTFVQHKSNQVWIWIALCRSTRQVMAFHVGLRRIEDAQQLWQNLPTQAQQAAHFYSDRLTAYRTILPQDRHCCRGKVTNHLERFNNTLRQRVAPLVRRTLSFAKSLTGLQQRLAFFFNHYNLTLTS